MEERHVGDVAALDHAAVDARDRTLAGHQPLQSVTPEDEHDLGPHQGELSREVRRARLGLIRHGVAVLRRPAFEDVGDVHVAAAQADTCKQRVKQLSCGAHERLALAILVEARRLADDHDVGRARPDARDGLGSRRVEPALGARSDLGVKKLKLR